MALKMAVFAPMPTASVTTAIRVKPGRLKRFLSAYRMSPKRLSTIALLFFSHKKAQKPQKKEIKTYVPFVPFCGWLFLCLCGSFSYHHHQRGVVLEIAGAKLVDFAQNLCPQFSSVAAAIRSQALLQAVLTKLFA